KAQAHTSAQAIFSSHTGCRLAATFNTTWHPLSFNMKLLFFYSGLLATLLQTIFGSSFSGGGSLTSTRPGRSNKKIVGKLDSKEIVAPGKESTDDHDKGKVTKDEPKSLTERRPRKILVDAVTGFFNKARSIFVSTSDWLFEDEEALAKE